MLSAIFLFDIATNVPSKLIEVKEAHLRMVIVICFTAIELLRIAYLRDTTIQSGLQIWPIACFQA